MKLTPHEQKILKIVQDNPGIINDPAKRETVAKKNGLTEKTLRNRIAELKKRDLIKKPSSSLKRNKKPLITENDEINLKEIWNIFFNNKSLVMKVALVCTTIGLSYSLLATIYFESRISLYPAGELSQTSGVLGDFQGLAKSFGLGGLASAPTYNIPDIIKSRRLKKNIVLRKWKTQEFPDGSNLIKYWELDKPAFFSPMKFVRKFLPSGGFSSSKLDKETYEAILELDGLISVKEEISGMISVTVLMEDPNLAASITNYIADYVKEFISIEQEKEAIKQKEFIYDQMLSAKSDLSDSELKLTNFFKKYPLALGNPDLQLQQGRLTREIEENQAVYITLRQQYEIAKIEAEEDKLFINILDTGDVAVRKSKPKRLLILLSSIMFGMMSSVLIILNRNKLLFKQ